MHVECLNGSKLKNKLLYHIQKYDEMLLLSNNKCMVDGNEILNPRHILFFGLLTSDENEPLYDFNYLVFNINNIQDWVDLRDLLLLLGSFLQKGNGKGWEDSINLKIY